VDLQQYRKVGEKWQFALMARDAKKSPPPGPDDWREAREFKWECFDSGPIEMRSTGYSPWRSFQGAPSSEVLCRGNTLKSRVVGRYTGPHGLCGNIDVSCLTDLRHENAYFDRSLIECRS
jgi:hypothetical protein